MSLLCVLSAAPRTPAQVRPLARRLLSMRPCADALLLLCDLPDAFAAVMPEDITRSAGMGMPIFSSRAAVSSGALMGQLVTAA